MTENDSQKLQAKASSTKTDAVIQQKKRICCVCKDTKRLRDECIIFNGEDKCKAFIEAHNACLRSEGFSVQ